MRSLERWLHQHIFKVGWLVTKNLQTTTILYYTIFLPGVFLHELIVWLIAGVLNIRASGEFKFPEKQEIAELKLQFVKYDAKKIGTFRLFIINLMPLVGGIGFIWFAINNPLNMSGFFGLLSGDPTITVGDAVTRLTTSPDFLLWMYLVFVVSATMTPDPSNLRGWRLLLPPIVIAIVALYALGIGDRVLGNFLLSISQGASVLTGIFAAIIGVNLFVTAVLGAVESSIERVTGDSATFEKGKLVAMRRADIVKMRAEQAEKARRAAQRQQAAAARAAAGPPSIYKLQLPIPAAPDKDSLILGESVGQNALPGFTGASNLPSPPVRPALTEPSAASSSVPPRPVPTPASAPAASSLKPSSLSPAATAVASKPALADDTDDEEEIDQEAFDDDLLDDIDDDDDDPMQDEPSDDDADVNTDDSTN